MALNFLNAVEGGGNENSAITYDWAYGARFCRKILWLWLHKVIGWQDIEKSGSYWDNPQLTGTDGASHAVDASRFSSATGGFTAPMVGSWLLVCPTAAPATSGGFSSPARNGFYYIRGWIDSNNIIVDTFRGVHTDGLPLGESGLNFEVVRFTDAATQIPRLNDYFVLRGTGANGDFDLRVREAAGANYSPWRCTISPFSDWVPGSPGSFVPGNRITAETDLGNVSTADRGTMFAAGDLSHFVLCMHGYDETRSNQVGDLLIFYAGEIAPFHAASDLRPMVCAIGQEHVTTHDLLDDIKTDVRMVAADDTTQLSAKTVYAAESVATRINALEGRRTRSKFSGRFVQTPLMIGEFTAGVNELRGQFKDFFLGHDVGLTEIYPFGTNLERLRVNNTVISWNGSRVLQSIL